MDRNGGENEKKRMTRTSFTIFLFALMWACAVLVKAVVVMFAERSYWQDVSKEMTSEIRVIEPRRGNILSDEGLQLASSMKQYRVLIDFYTSGNLTNKKLANEQYRKDTLFERHLDEFVAGMHELFPQYSENELREHYRKGKAQKSRGWLLLPGTSRNSFPVSYNQYKALGKLAWTKPRYENWFFSAESKISRKKPFGTLAGRTLGELFESKDSARYGLELAFDSLLRGVKGQGHVEKVQNVKRVIADIPQIDGCDVVTTLNVSMQDIAETALRREVEKIGAVSGCAVLMEVKTGDIKAIANINRNANGTYSENQNNAVKDLFEPGSTFKPVSIMVALDDGKLNPDDSVFCEHGRYYGFGGGSVMTDVGNGYGMLTVAGVLMKSCNIGVSKLINARYKDDPTAFVDGIYRTGINTKFDLQLTGTAAPVIRRDAYWDNTRLPWMSIGYNTQLPVVNTLAFYNGLANGGKMVAPRLVTKVVKDGEIVKSFPVTVVREHMCKPETAEILTGMLKRVVAEGTGKQAASTHFEVAGKTGTAQLSQGAGGYKSGTKTHMVSFCGFFPADDPVYSMIVSIRTSGGAAGGGTMAAPVFHEISEKIMARLNLSGPEAARDTVHKFLPDVKSGDLLAADRVLEELDLNPQWTNRSALRRDTIWGAVVSDSGKIVMRPGNIGYDVVPDVVGMGAKDALYLLEKCGLRVDMTGVGTVRSQSIRRGTKIRKGDRIAITLRM